MQQMMVSAASGVVKKPVQECLHVRHSQTRKDYVHGVIGLRVPLGTQKGVKTIKKGANKAAKGTKKGAEKAGEKANPTY